MTVNEAVMLNKFEPLGLFAQTHRAEHVLKGEDKKCCLTCCGYVMCGELTSPMTVTVLDHGRCERNVWERVGYHVDSVPVNEMDICEDYMSMEENERIWKERLRNGTL